MRDLRAVGDLTYDANHILGVGSYGTLVFSGFHRNNTPVAVKRVQRPFIRNELNILQTEVGLMQKASDHLNILRFICALMNIDYL